MSEKISEIEIIDSEITGLIVAASRAALTLPAPEAFFNAAQVKSDAETPYYIFLKEFCSMFRPAVAVELGTYHGLGSLSLAMGNPDGQVISIDVYDDRRSCERLAPNIKFSLGDSIMMAAHFRHLSVDLLFIDTDHDGRAYDEFVAWRPVLRKGSVVMFDDTKLNEEMLKAIERVKPLFRRWFDLDELHSTGFAVGIY